MGGALILEFQTFLLAQTCLTALNQVAAVYWQSEGYTVNQTPDGPVLIGKNALTLEDNPSAITDTWDHVQESPDGTFYFTSPVMQYPTWRDFMPEGVDLGIEKEMPEEWNENI